MKSAVGAHTQRVRAQWLMAHRFVRDDFVGGVVALGRQVGRLGEDMEVQEASSWWEWGGGSKRVGRRP